MKKIILLLLVLSLFGCKHRLVGERLPPSNYLQPPGHTKIDGKWVRVDYDYKVENQTIFINGILDFDKSAEFQEWEHLELILTFLFLDEENIVIDSTMRRKPLHTNCVGQVPVNYEFPNKKEYKAMRLLLQVKGGLH
ncbi:MAG: hypothetical protein BA863_02450 [Desulfovibrio sp. S3730MH75]|nr:MAG: hypothetical protein BA863_02450 [Desulfovibrio sp. S3730MH75]